jgi:hypothetical protein
MIDTADPAATAEHLLSLERGALDRWGNGDPGGFLDVYAPDITYFDPLAARRIDGRNVEANPLALVVHTAPGVREHHA